MVHSVRHLNAPSSIALRILRASACFVPNERNRRSTLRAWLYFGEGNPTSAAVQAPGRERYRDAVNACTVLHEVNDSAAGPRAGATSENTVERLVTPS
jgi:hypothetical protein